MHKTTPSNTNRGTLKTGLKTTGILDDVSLTNFIELVILVLAKPNFVKTRIDLIPNNERKAKTLCIYKDSIFSFIYDVKTTTPGEYPDPSICNVSKFWLKIKVAVELQIHSCNFKMKEKEKNIGYSFKLIGLYKLGKVKILPLSIPEKSWKDANKFIATSFRTENMQSALNLLE